MNDASDAGRCPVCNARFRETSTCSRCGADLAPLMCLAAEAHRLRAAARYAVCGGDFAGAWACAHQAQKLCATEAGSDLALLTSLLAERI